MAKPVLYEWAQDQVSLPPTTQAQWEQGFTYLDTATGGKVPTYVHDYPFSEITKAVRWCLDALPESGVATDYASNRISVSQMVVDGATGDPLPQNGVSTDYAISAEMALGWVVQTAVVNGTKDANGNVTADSGVVRYTVNKDEKGLIGLDESFTSVLQSDGSKLTQVYADGSGIIEGEDATTQWIEIDFSQPTGFFYVGSISEQRGRPEVKSVANVERDARGGRRIIVEDATQRLTVYPDGMCEQIIAGQIDSGQGSSTISFLANIDISRAIHASITAISNGTQAAGYTAITNSNITISRDPSQTSTTIGYRVKIVGYLS